MRQNTYFLPLAKFPQCWEQTKKAVISGHGCFNSTQSIHTTKQMFFSMFTWCEFYRLYSLAFSILSSVFNLYVSPLVAKSTIPWRLLFDAVIPFLSASIQEVTQWQLDMRNREGAENRRCDTAYDFRDLLWPFTEIVQEMTVWSHN